MYRRFESAATTLAEHVFKSVGSLVGDKAYMLTRKGEFASLLDMSVKPTDYICPDKFRDDYLVCELMSKFDSFDLGIDRDAVALAKFDLSEQSCSATNKRLSVSYESGLLTPYSPESFIWTARVKIAKLLGPLNWDECSVHFGFGPGASTSVNRSRGDAYFKYGGVKPHSTKANSLLALCAVKCVPSWFNYLLAERDPVNFLNLPVWQQAEELFEIVPGNRVTTVPKSAKTNRVIAIEPDMNMYIQKGLGGVIRRRLKRVGVNLDDQTWNQKLAGIASLTDEYATIDLSSASDTVSLKLVEVLLPSDWFEALKQSRSESGTMPDGRVVNYQKVSSMGNGFTFELESLIFWAIIESVYDLLNLATHQSAVYGDDLIVHIDSFHTIMWLLKYLGFSPNTKKTFHKGPFRESCGKHYFLGVDVTPFYIRKDIASPDRLIWFANSIRRWARLSYGLDGRFKICYLTCIDLLPISLRKPSIPEHLGDIALWGDFDEVRPSRVGRGHYGWKALGYQEKPGRLVPGDVPLLIRNLGVISRRAMASTSIVLQKIYRDPSVEAESELDLSVVTTKPRCIKWRVVKPPVVRWDSYGPWYSP